MRKAEVIALVPAAQHSKTPTPKAWTKGTSEPRQLTQTLHAHTPRHQRKRARGTPQTRADARPGTPAGTPTSGRRPWPLYRAAITDVGAWTMDDFSYSDR
ncbi:hypothetical protein GCM10010317_000460 [Streptomyces mirabilis]|nr:hypothetical protein GCM10010317_000460 [Streptomyces mirabilis]